MVQSRKQPRHDRLEPLKRRGRVDPEPGDRERVRSRTARQPVVEQEGEPVPATGYRCSDAGVPVPVGVRERPRLTPQGVGEQLVRPVDLGGDLVVVTEVEAGMGEGVVLHPDPAALQLRELRPIQLGPAKGRTCTSRVVAQLVEGSHSLTIGDRLEVPHHGTRRRLRETGEVAAGVHELSHLVPPVRPGGADEPGNDERDGRHTEATEDRQSVLEHAGVPVVEGDQCGSRREPVPALRGGFDIVQRHRHHRFPNEPHVRGELQRVVDPVVGEHAKPRRGHPPVERLRRTAREEPLRPVAPVSAHRASVAGPGVARTARRAIVLHMVVRRAGDRDATDVGDPSSDRTPRGAGHPAVHGVLVTYRRPDDLEVMFRRLAEQERGLDTLLVVDNDPAESARAVVAGLPAGDGVRDRPRITYVASGANLGPAGGIALGMRYVLSHAADRDWLLALDDDNPPRRPDMLAELERFGTRLREQEPTVGAVGASGSRFEAERARGVRVPDDELAGAVRSDWIGGNNLPLYSVHAIRAVGVFDDQLFFGFDDLEYGLRLRAAGFGIYVHGGLWHRGRDLAGRLGIEAAPARALGEPTWRRYYSLRNLIYILRKQGHNGGAARLAARGLGKPVYNLPRHPALAAQHLALNSRAILDAYRGRMGLTVSPVPKQPVSSG